MSACLESNTSLCGVSDIIIIIRDLNDNSPQFNQTVFDIQIPLNLPADTELLQVIATDSDSGKNGEVLIK